VCVFSGSKFCSALISYSARPTLPGYMVPVLVVCGPFDLFHGGCCFVFPPVLTTIQSSIFATVFSLSSYRLIYTYSDIMK
jgi:hypothetical protein